MIQKSLMIAALVVFFAQPIFAEERKFTGDGAKGIYQALKDLVDETCDGNTCHIGVGKWGCQGFAVSDEDNAVLCVTSDPVGANLSDASKKIYLAIKNAGVEPECTGGFCALEWSKLSCTSVGYIFKDYSCSIEL